MTLRERLNRKSHCRGRASFSDIKDDASPGVFEVDDFCLVPRSSPFGAIEIKRSNYSSVGTELETFS
jgi:hypothetical protein